MKRDTLNVSKSHASVIKITLLTILLAGCMNVLADDSRSPLVLFNKWAAKNKCEKASLHKFGTEFDLLFRNFFDPTNKDQFSIHKARFYTTIAKLEVYLSTANFPKSTDPESTANDIKVFIQEFKNFIAELDSKAQPILKKGKNAVNITDIWALKDPLQKYSKLIPDSYFKNPVALVNNLLHRFRC